MVIPKWSNEYSVHNDSIDKEHKQLFELAQRCYEILNKNVDRSEIKAILIEFFNYMRTHFSHEEHYMKSIGYPYLAEHAKLHKEIMREMASVAKTAKQTSDLKQKLIYIARDWLVGHIMQEDMKIEEWRAIQVSNNYIKMLDPNNKSNSKANAVYVYQCKCKIHKMDKSNHAKLSKIDSQILCKDCKEPLEFLHEA